MARPRSSYPTEVELQILDVLWDEGPSTVRSIHNTLIASKQRDTGYSTTLKMIQVMHEKGLLTRDTSVRPQIYKATVSREATQRGVLEDMARRLFGGSAAQIVQCMLSSDQVSDEEIHEMDRLIRKAKHDTKPDSK